MTDNTPDEPTGYIHLLENSPEEVFKAFLFDLAGPLTNIEGCANLLAEEDSPISDEQVSELMSDNTQKIR